MTDLATAAMRRGRRFRRRRRLARQAMAGSLVVVLSLALAAGLVHATAGHSIAPTHGGQATSTTGAPPSTRPGGSATSVPSSSVTPTTRPRVVGPAGGPVPAGFEPMSFTAVSLEEWWLLGTATCSGSASGSRCLSIVRSTNGGTSFGSIPPPPVGVGSVTELRFASPMVGYAFGPELWETTDGGAHWSRVGTAGTVTDVEASAGYAYEIACASAQCQTMQLSRSSIASGQWAVVRTPARLGYGAGYVVDGADLYVITGNDPPDAVLVSSDAGASFTRRIDPCESGLGGRLAVAADGSGALWAACPTGTMAAVMRSVDGASTWTTATETGRFPNTLGLAAASSSRALAWPSTAGAGGALELSTNAGASYSAVLGSPATSRVLWAGYSDSARAYALVSATASGRTELYESEDGGASWSVVPIEG